jgi:uncharacterized ferredoxin-like protein
MSAMKIESQVLEDAAVMETARLMAAAAISWRRSVLPSEEIGPLVAEMKRPGEKHRRRGMKRDAENLRQARLIVFSIGLTVGAIKE